MVEAFLSAAWLGILTSISPCPLASNIAAVSFISKDLSRSRALVSGALYSLGRAMTYTALAVAIAWNLTTIPVVANAIQEHMNRALGPILIAVGIIMLGLIPFPAIELGGKRFGQRLGEKAGFLPSFFIGVLFALSFCPISAALFFGSLIPLSLSTGRAISLPLLFAFGTALPVVGAAIAIALGVEFTTRFFEGARRIERLSRPATALVFIGVGLYYSWNYLIGI
ncbi:MAG TPA: sulfite exporter TauE/SafE family protein [Dissulfuribacter thermophilus]|uniref:Sulfite exporter TauE/SafE family protein n=1 Tax=Dissulfuribacter thermophilus TaxID=1156395 RepID=A0A7V2WSH7_9BACT|nr:sulfite exporter TauE/SafE family protein [Dissulfuribacter thermophilus]